MVTIDILCWNEAIAVVIQSAHVLAYTTILNYNKSAQVLAYTTILNYNKSAHVLAYTTIINYNKSAHVLAYTTILNYNKSAQVLAYTTILKHDYSHQTLAIQTLIWKTQILIFTPIGNFLSEPFLICSIHRDRERLENKLDTKYLLDSTHFYP